MRRREGSEEVLGGSRVADAVITQAGNKRKLEEGGEGEEGEDTKQ